MEQICIIVVVAVLAYGLGYESARGDCTSRWADFVFYPPKDISDADKPWKK